MEIIHQQTKPGETALILTGTLNFMVRKEFQMALQGAQQEGIQHITLDLSQVSFIDCVGLGILASTKQELNEAQITLSLLTAPGRVFDVLKQMNLD
jgi:anti-anti-sigma factor